ncbi:MAG: Imm42 family immunity protein [Raineya sp.]|jgi:hypothetical protein|nr:Imm42 family immunity protein [Raineya sp.]
MIIGNKSNFAIEFEVISIRKNSIYGDIRLWLQGKYLGDFMDSDYLLPVSSYFTSLLEYQENFKLDTEIENLSYKEIFEIHRRQQIQDVISYKLRKFCDRPPFDAFHDICFIKEDKLVFVWKVREQTEWYSVSLKEYNKDVQTAEILLSDYENVVNECIKTLNYLLQHPEEAPYKFSPEGKNIPTVLPQRLHLLGSKYHLAKEIIWIQAPSDSIVLNQIDSFSLIASMIDKNQTEQLYRINDVKLKVVSLGEYTNFENIEPFEIILDEQVQHFPKNLKIVVPYRNIEK